MTVKYEVRYNGFCHYINVDEPIHLFPHNTIKSECSIII